MIAAKHLSKQYGPINAVDEVSFEVGRGEIVGFLGPNAAGKTTTMKMLTGSIPASRGTAEIAGFNVADAPLEAKRRIGYLPENVPLYPEMRVSSFLKYVAEAKDVPPGKRSGEVDRVIEACGLAAVARRVTGHLSKGYRQRVGLAQALINDPPVLILDEPTVGLDPRQIVEIRHMIKDLAQDHTVLLSTHILPEVAMICRRVLIINNGRLVAEDAMENLAESAAVTTIELEVRGSREAVVEQLRNVACVSDARHVKDFEYAVTFDATGAESAPAAIEEVAKAVIEKGFGLRRLSKRARSLEAAFMEAIANQGDTPEAPEVRPAQGDGA